MDRPIAPPSWWRRYWPYAAGALALIVAGAWLLSGPSGRIYRVPIDRLTISTVRRGPFEDYAAVRANVAPLITDYLTTEQSGTVKQVLVEDGAEVKAGEALIVLSSPQLELSVINREADTARQISELENTELELEQTRFQYQKDLLSIQYQMQKLRGQLARDRRLAAANAIPQVTFDKDKEKYQYESKLRDATIASHRNEQTIRARQLAQLQATLKELHASLIAARASLDNLTLRAPMDGQLSALNAEVGEAKAQGAVLGQIDSQNRFKLTARVDEFYLGRVALGQFALFRLNGRNYRAKVAKIYPQVTNGTFRIDMTFLGQAPVGIHAGQAIDIKLELGGAKIANMLPNGPFYQDTGGNWVFVLTPSGDSAIRRNVKLGARNPDEVEVLSGLKPGDRVITSSYEAYANMDRVEFEAAATHHSGA